MRTLFARNAELKYRLFEIVAVAVNLEVNNYLKIINEREKSKNEKNVIG